MPSFPASDSSGVRRRFTFGRFAISAVVAAALLVGPPVSETASARPAGAFFEKLATLLDKAGVDRDSIEMARYSVNETSHAGVVFSHAAAQDYPFFALVGAVKASKDKDLPGIGVFTQSKCESPVTAIDVVFGTADQHIDNAKGKADTKTLIGGAKAIAADYAKQTTAEAKAEAQSQLAESIPYFGEIKTICSFGFETNFAMDRNFQQAASKTSGDILLVYRSFRDGEYATGISTLGTLGISGEMACGLVDTLVDESLIGRTPLLGDLAKGACSGFVGKVLDGAVGIVKGGVGLVEAGVSYIWEGGKAGACKIYSLVGSGCSKASPPDPLTLAVGGAQNWCAARGGLGEGNFPNASNFGFNCNDGSVCRRKNGGATMCVTAEEKAANAAQRRALLDADLAVAGSKLAQWQSQFVGMWQPMCVNGDNGCRNAITNASGGVRGQALTAAKGGDSVASYFTVTNAAKTKAEAAALAAIEESRFRRNPAKWAAGVDKIAATKCLDAQCKAELETLKATIVQTIAGQHKMKPKALYTTMTPILVSGNRAVRDYVTMSLSRAGKQPVGASPIKPGTPVVVPPAGRVTVPPVAPARPTGAPVSSKPSTPTAVPSAPSATPVLRRVPTPPAPAPTKPAPTESEPSPSTGERPPRGG